MVKAKQGLGGGLLPFTTRTPVMDDGRSKTPRAEGWWFLTGHARRVVNGRSKTRVGGGLLPFTTHTPRLDDGRSKTRTLGAPFVSIVSHAEGVVNGRSKTRAGAVCSHLPLVLQ
jgi:hypothetical protein